MDNPIKFAVAVIAGCLACALPGLAHPQTSDGKPKFAFSITEIDGSNDKGGPLFDKVKAAFAAAGTSDEAFADVCASNASLELNGYVGKTRQHVPFHICDSARGHANLHRPILVL
jgi:hypothetical protein